MLGRGAAPARPGLPPMASGKVAVGTSKADEKEFLIPENFQNNKRVQYWLRQYCAIVAGCVAGVLGLTNVVGFAVYPLFMLLSNAMLIAKCEGHIDTFFTNWRAANIDGFFDAAMTYVLFWTFVYDAAHLF